MTKLKKCSSCKKYTLKENCEKCKIPAKDAHYKFIRIKDDIKTKIESF